MLLSLASLTLSLELSIFAADTQLAKSLVVLENGAVVGRLGLDIVQKLVLIGSISAQF